MPSPIAHAAVGYVLYTRTHEPFEINIDAFSPALATVVGLSLLPDLDTIPGIVSGNFAQTHNRWTHSLITGLAVTLISSGVIWLARRDTWKHWSALILLCYELHILMDYVTVGRGVMLLWPFSITRYSPPVSIFYGLRWSKGTISNHHIWTVATELIFAIVIILTSSRLIPRDRTHAT